MANHLLSGWKRLFIQRNWWSQSSSLISEIHVTRVSTLTLIFSVPLFGLFYTFIKFSRYYQELWRQGHLELDALLSEDRNDLYLNMKDEVTGRSNAYAWWKLSQKSNVNLTDYCRTPGSFLKFLRVYIWDTCNCIGDSKHAWTKLCIHKSGFFWGKSSVSIGHRWGYLLVKYKIVLRDAVPPNFLRTVSQIISYTPPTLLSVQFTHSKCCIGNYFQHYIHQNCCRLAPLLLADFLVVLLSERN